MYSACIYHTQNTYQTHPKYTEYINLVRTTTWLIHWGWRLVDNHMAHTPPQSLHPYIGLAVSNLDALGGDLEFH